MRRTCSSSGSSSSRSARRSSSITAASWRRWASGQGAHDGGHLGRVHVAQAGGLGGHRARRGEQLGQLVGVDEAVARLAADRVAPHEADLGDLPRRAATVDDRPQGDVADGLVAELAVDHRLTDEDLAGTRLERVEVDVPAAQPEAVAAQLGQPAGVDEDAPALALGDEADHAGRLTGTPGDGHDVLDPPDLGARPCRATATASRGTRRSARQPCGQRTTEAFSGRGAR